MGRKRVFFYFSLFLLVMLIIFSPLKNINFNVIKESDFNDKKVKNGEEIIIDSKKHSNYDEVYTVVDDKIKCKSLEDKEYKGCEAIFEIEDKNPIGKRIKNPDILISFLEPEEIRNMAFYFSEEYDLEDGEIKNSIYPKRTNVISEEKRIRKTENTPLPLPKKDYFIKIVEKKRIFKEFVKLEELKERGKKEEGVILKEGGVDNINLSNNFDDNSLILESDKSNQSEYLVENESIYLNSTVSFDFDKNESFVSTITGNLIKDNEEFYSSRPFAIKVYFEVPFYSDNQFNFSLKEESFEAKIDPVISACAQLSTEDEIFLIDQDINVENGCFVVTEPNITIDCQGHFISYGNANETSYAVWSNASQTIVKGCIFNQTGKVNNSGAVIYFSSDDSLAFNNSIITNANYVSGIEIEDSNAVNLSKNTITSLGNNSYAIYSSLGQETFINENTIISTGLSSSSIYLHNSNDSIITNNLFNSSNNNSDTVFLYNNYNNIIENNSFFSEGYNSNTFRVFNIKNSNFSNNNFNSYGVYGSAYFVEGNSLSDYNHFINNSFKGIGDDRYGYMSYSGNNNSHINNSIFISGNFSYGLLLYNSKDNIFENLSITSGGKNSTGAFLDFSSDNSTFYFLRINSNSSGTYPFYNWYKGNSFSISDSIINSSINEIEVYLHTQTNEQGGIYNLTNVSFNRLYWNPSVNGQLIRAWYLDILINSTTTPYLEDIEVIIKNSNNTTIFNGLTDENGQVNRLLLQEYIQTSSGRLYYTNHTIYALNQENTLFEEFNLTNNQQILLTFGEELQQVSQKNKGGGGGNNSCTENWTCSFSSYCNNGKRERLCKDLNNCGRKNQELSLVDCKNSSNNLFDINMELLEEDKLNEKDALVKISLLNIGLPGKTKVKIEYVLINLDNLLKVYSEEEFIEVETQKEFLKKINTTKLYPGNYKYSANLSYEGQIDLALSEFAFKIGDNEKINKKLIVLIILITLAILFYISFHLIQIRNFKKGEIIDQILKNSQMG